MSLQREKIPTLQAHLLKMIAKQPERYLGEKSFSRSNHILASKQYDDLFQILIDNITDTGRMTDEVIPVKFINPGLPSLSLKNSKLTLKGFAQYVERCNSLLQLNLSGSFLVSDDVVSIVLSNCLKLEKIDLRNCRKITDESLNLIAAKGSCLSSINLGGNFNVSLEGLIHFFSNNSRMELYKELYISGLPTNDEVLKLIISRCPHLVALGISFSFLTEPVLRSLLTNIGPTLRTLLIAWIQPVSGMTIIDLDISFLDFLSRSCPVLENLDITGIKNMSITAILQLLDFKLYQVRKIKLIDIL